MYFHAAALDYDGTLAHQGLVEEATIAELERFVASGRRLILVSGRELEDLERVFSRLDLFDLAVLENGALLYDPRTREETALCPAPGEAFVELLRTKGVEPMSVGRGIVAAWEPHQTACLEAIKELGLELEIIFNKGAVMILPTGVNKASGLAAALDRLKLSPLNVVSMGDAENDHAMLRYTGCGVAVANALPSVKETADMTAKHAHGRGVEEVLSALQDAEERFLLSDRHAIPLGRDGDGLVVSLSPAGGPVLIGGSSGIGKSTLATALTEQFVEKEHQFVVIDPEGDYDGLEGAVVAGSAHEPPAVRSVMSLLDDPGTNVVVNIVGVDVKDRPAYVRELLPDLAKLRSRTGRPHWIIMDEAHHLLPSTSTKPEAMLERGVVLITVHPEAVAKSVNALVDTVVALGPEARQVVAAVYDARGADVPDLPIPDGDVVLVVRGPEPGRLLEPVRPAQKRKRHRRKYATGKLSEQSSFYFTGPEGALNLRAHNLDTFLQLLEGIDDRTWEYHLGRGDYSRWIKDGIKDESLSQEVAELEQRKNLDPAAGRELLGKAIRRRYTAPAEAAS